MPTNVQIHRRDAKKTLYYLPTTDFHGNYTEQSKDPSYKFKGISTKIKQKAYPEFGCLEVIYQLCFVLLGYFLHCLVFKKDFIFH